MRLANNVSNLVRASSIDFILPSNSVLKPFSSWSVLICVIGEGTSQPIKCLNQKKTLLDPTFDSLQKTNILIIHSLIQGSIHFCSQLVWIAMKGFQSSWHCTGQCSLWFSCLMFSFPFWDLLVACHQLEVHPTPVAPHQEQRRLPSRSLAPWLAWLRNWSQCRAWWLGGTGV